MNVNSVLAADVGSLDISGLKSGYIIWDFLSNENTTSTSYKASNSENSTLSFTFDTASEAQISVAYESIITGIKYTLSSKSKAANTDKAPKLAKPSNSNTKPTEGNYIKVSAERGDKFYFYGYSTSSSAKSAYIRADVADEFADTCIKSGDIGSAKGTVTEVCIDTSEFSADTDLSNLYFTADSNNVYLAAIVKVPAKYAPYTSIIQTSDGTDDSAVAVYYGSEKVYYAVAVVKGTSIETTSKIDFMSDSKSVCETSKVYKEVQFDDSGSKYTAANFGGADTDYVYAATIDIGNSTDEDTTIANWVKNITMSLTLISQ